MLLSLRGHEKLIEEFSAGDGPVGSLERLKRIYDGPCSFLSLPDSAELVTGIKSFVAALPREMDSCLVLGIGGSSLGPRAIIEMLGAPSGMRFVFLDNVDPVQIAESVETLDLSKTLVLAVTKSGSTIETMSQFALFRDMMIRELGKDAYRKQVIGITDPEKGMLRQIVKDDDLSSFPIPPEIGGRFSVLTAVGLLPAALAGIDIDRLLDGARRQRDRILGDPIEENQAALSAAIHVGMDRKYGRRIRVLMPYSSRLVALADWFVQLWAESLGKTKDVGPTPIRAIGVTDQHSQLQLYVEGPDDKVINIWDVAKEATDIAMPGEQPHSDMGYLAGRTFGELFKAELEGTQTALLQAGRPVLRTTFQDRSPEVLGAFFLATEAETVLAGDLYGVNPYDQPGVEAGKKVAFKLMGRPGFE